MKNIYLFLVFVISCNYGISQSISNGENINSIDGVALQKYDAVSYFVSKPKKGKLEYSTTYKGVEYLFSSAKNLNEFTDNQEKYLPAYGGWCAYAIGAKGSLVSVDPETFKIVNGKLYLFYNSYFNNTLKKWNNNEAKLLVKANKNWNSKYER